MLVPNNQWFLHPTKKRCHPLLEGSSPKQERWRWQPGDLLVNCEKGLLIGLTLLKLTARGLLEFTSGSLLRSLTFTVSCTHSGLNPLHSV